MYKLSVPMMNNICTDETRARYLEELKKAGADRVFLCLPRYLSASAARAESLALLKVNVRYFEDAGLEVGTWISTMGHGGALDHEESLEAASFTRVQGFNGGTCDDSFCCTDPDFLAAIADFVKEMAAAGAKMIMLDDDFRFSYRSYGMGCMCKNHMRLFEERTGKTWKAEDLPKLLFAGKENTLRTQFYDLMNETMLDFAKKLRAALDTVNPKARLGFCAAPCSFDTDGTDAIAITRAFAGNTKPFFRLTGAPYWVWAGTGNCDKVLSDVISLERLEMQWMKRAPEIEIFAEGDVYPRPRYRVPAWLEESFDGVLRANGENDGILKYMLDYTHSPDFETGYVAQHIRHMPELAEIAEKFADGETEGVCVFDAERKVRTWDIPEDRTADMGFLQTNLMAPALKLLDRTATPMTFEPEGHVICTFAESARQLPARYLGNGLILDMEGARNLAVRGVDVGYTALEKIAAPGTEHFPSLCGAPAETLHTETGGAFYRATLKDGATVLSTFDNGIPAVYTYENAMGQKFLVYTFDAYTVSFGGALMRNYCRAAQLHEAVRWLSGKAIPAEVTKQPDTYLLVKDAKTEKGVRRTVGIWNLFEDAMLTPRVKLDRPFGTITFFGGAQGTLDGDTVIFTSDIPVHGFGGFTVAD